MGILDSIIKGITGNPIVGAALVIGVPLFLFRKQIGEFFDPVGQAFEGAGEAIGGAGQAITDLFGGAGEAIGGIFEGPPQAFGEIGEAIPIGPPAPDFFQGFTDFFAGIGETLGGIIPSVPEVQGAIQFPPEERPLTLAQFAEPERIIAPVETQISDQQFFGGGPSFIGGTIFETSIERLSLGQIIEMGLAGSASEAASLKAEATGFTDEELAFLERGQEISPLGDVGPVVSDVQFAGLSPQEIALRLTGGPITRF